MAEAMGRHTTPIIIATLLTLTLGSANALIADDSIPLSPLQADIHPEEHTIEAIAQTEHATAAVQANIDEGTPDATTVHVHASTASTPIQQAEDTPVEKTATVGDLLTDDEIKATLAYVDGVILDLMETPERVGYITIDEEAALEDRTRAATEGHAVFTDEPSAPRSGISAIGIALLLAPATAAATFGTVQASGSVPWVRRWVVATPLASLYSRIERRDVLEHETRERIYQAVTKAPGLSIRCLAERLDISRSTARHHVRILNDAGMVDSCMMGRCRIHFVTGQEDRAVQRHLLANENRARIQATLQEDERSLSEIVDLVGVNAGSVHFHLEKLCEAGLAKRHENGRVTYRATKEVEGVVFETLA